MTFKIKPTKEWGIFFLFFGLVLINHCKDKKKPENIEYTLIHRVDWSILVKRDHIIYNFVKLKIIKMCFVYMALNSTMTCYSFFVYNNAHKVEYVHITLIWYQYTKISNRRVAMHNYVNDSFFSQWKKFTHSKNLRAISHSDLTFYFVFPQQVFSYGSEETI